MRRVLHGDLVAMARMLLLQPPEERETICHRAIVQTRLADRYRQDFGAAHPEFGDGSLAGWAGQYAQAPEPFLDDPAYAGCLRLMLACLEEVGADIGENAA